MSKILKSILLFFAFLAVAIFTTLLLADKCPNIISENHISYLIFIGILYLISLVALILSTKFLSPTGFVYAFLSVTVVKMLIAMSYMLIIALNGEVNPIKDGILFMSLYSFFLIDEIISLLYLKK